MDVMQAGSSSAEFAVLDAPDQTPHHNRHWAEQERPKQEQPEQKQHGQEQPEPD
jgi:hypothetical protein